MEFDKIHLFYQVVSKGSYTAAAEHLGCSKGYLSQQVKKLEQTLSTQLLVRNTRNMKLTNAGELLFQQAVKLSSLWYETKLALEATEQQISGLVSCTAPVALAKYLIWPCMEPLLADLPELKFSIESGNHLQNLIDANYDFAVRITRSPPEDMIAKKLCDFTYDCYASPEYVAEHGRPVTASDLKLHSCLALTHWSNWKFHGDEGLVEVDARGILTCSDNELLKIAGVAGKGIIRMPEYMVTDELKKGNLIRLLPDYTGEQNSIYLLYPQIKSRPAKVSRCIEHIRLNLINRGL